VVKIFVFKIKKKKISLKEEKKMLQFLSLEEIERLDELKSKKSKLLYLYSRFLIRKIIANFLVVPSKEIFFLKDNFGKLRLKKPVVKNFDFSLSYCKEYIVLALSDKPIGVDIEKRQKKDLSRLIPIGFHPEELNYLKQLESFKRKEISLALWVLKEAYVKALGLGSLLPFNSFCFVIKSKSIFLKKRRKKWKFNIFNIENHKLAVCFQGGGLPELNFY